MDYKDKYEQALERARTFNQRWQGIESTDSELALQELKEIFPELKESEDERNERIRKALKSYFDSEMSDYGNIEWMKGIRYGEVIAWLEKQGEQKPAENKGMNLVEEEMTPFQKKVFFIIDTVIEKEQGLKQVCDELLRLAKDEIEQKPAEWSEEDEDIFNELVAFLEKGEYKFQHDLTMYAHWPKSLKQRMKGE